jgi:hypothetical protein
MSNAHIDATRKIMTNAKRELNDAMRACDDATMTITHKLTKSQRARLRRYFATHNVATTKFAKYSTRVITRDAYEFAMRA